MAEEESEDQAGEGGTAPNSKRLQEVWERALDRFDAVSMTQVELRAQSLEARRFVTIPGAMWEGVWGEQYENAPRPEVDKITKSLEKIETDYRENRVMPDFIPSDDAADSDTADMLDGTYRADAQHFKAGQAHDNAFQEGIRGGFGAWRLTTEYEDPYDPDNDNQRVNPGVAIVDADQSVYFYGGVLYDKSDAEACFVIVRELKPIAEEKWGAENLTPWPANQWRWQWDWYQPDVACIAEYYEYETTSERRVTFTQPLTGEEQRFFESEIDEASARELTGKGWKKTTRDVKRRRCRKYIINGTKVLKDCGYIAGDLIPIVPFYGRRDWVDNMERWRGHVLQRMDRQRIYNASISKIVETQAIAPYEVPIVDPEQVAGQVNGMTIAEHWARGNIDRLPFRVLNALRDNEGKPVQLGPLGKIEPPQVQPATAALLQITAADLSDDDQNVEEVKANTSTEAMEFAASRVDAKSAIYLDNFAQSMQRCAQIYFAMCRDVLVEPGRKVETLTIDGQDGTAELQEPYLNPETKVLRIRNDLSRGKYKVIAEVQEATATKRQKAVRQSLELAGVAQQIAPDLAKVELLTAVMNMDGEGRQDMKDWARSQLIAMGVVKPTPEEAQKIAAQEQEQQQPDAAQLTLMAQAKELESKATLNEASAQEKGANTVLKLAQAQAVGGPVSAPEAPTGLHAVEVREKDATATLKEAQAEKIRHEIGEKRVRLGHEIEMDRRDREQAERQGERAA